jgi:hypothetical protein
MTTTACAHAPKKKPPVIPPAVKVGATIVAAGVLAVCVVNSIPTPDPLPTSYRAAVEYVLKESIFTFGAFAAAFAFIGAVMRAMAQHGDDTHRGLDYAGKLFAVAATSLALWVPLLSWPALDDTWARNGLVAAAAIIAILAVVLSIHTARAKKAPPATS